jgi:hypothetical protein
MSDTAAGATDLLSNSAAPSPAPAPAPAPSFRPVGMPVTPAAFDAPEAVAVRAEIQAKIGDREFYQALKAERERGVTGPASQRWAELHKTGWPAVPAVTSLAGADAQAHARNEEQWSEYFSALRQRVPLTDMQVAEIRGGQVNADVYAWAKDEKDGLIKDRAFRTRLLDGDRAANREWGLVVQVLSLKPVPGFKFSPVQR